MNVHLNSLLIIYLHALCNLMNHWKLFNNWLIKNAILHLEMINWSLVKENAIKNTVIKQIIDMLLNQEENIYSCIYKMLINVC